MPRVPPIKRRALAGASAKTPNDVWTKARSAAFAVSFHGGSEIEEGSLFDEFREIVSELFFDR